MKMIGSLRRLSLCAALSGLLGLATTAVQAQTATYQFDLRAQPLADALRAVGHQTSKNILFDPALVEGISVPALRAELTVSDALKQLLTGTKLSTQEISTETVLIRNDTHEAAKKPVASKTTAVHATNGGLLLAQAETNPSAQGARSETRNSERGSSARAPAEMSRIVLDEIVVTGTHIRGVQPSSPVVTITQEEMRLSGHTNLGEAIRALSQNFSGGQNPGVAQGATGGGLANQNITGGSSLNLRGLGQDATLTLLNGTRLPYDGLFQATDISVIPVAAIERMEVLLDGASATYGSDAVGGVVNIVLKRDYDGAELSARYGEATDGGNAQTQYTGVGGATWDTGGFLVTGDIARTTAIRAGHRDYLGYMPNQDVSLHPLITQKGGLLSGHQHFGDSVEITLDAFLAEREMSRLSQGGTSSFFAVHTDSAIWGVSPALRLDLPRELSLRLHGFHGRNEVERYLPVFSLATGAQTSLSGNGYFNKAEAVEADIEGPLFTLPGGTARLAFGAGYRKNGFQNLNLLTGATSTEGASRSRYGYGEVNLPLISEAQEFPFATRLSFNGALRYENYRKFGEVTTPKVGLIWGLTRNLDIKARWGAAQCAAWRALAPLRAGPLCY